MADNRQFTDHNSIGNVNVYYKDRQLKERTAVSNSASIANLKFLLTTGDDEGFRTAIKSYIDEAIRSALGALVDNLDKGTGVSRILGTDSRHDLGTITPANLASVLGVAPSGDAYLWSTGDLDQIKTKGFGYISGATNSPSKAYGYLEVPIMYKTSNKEYGVQRWTDFDNTHCCQRVIYGGEFHQWKEVY